MAYLRLAWAADHFAYAALVPLVLLATLGIAAPGRRLNPKWQIAVSAVLGLMTSAACATLVAATHAYSRSFLSPEALWTTTLARNPNAWSAHNDLGSIRFDQGRLAEATAEFRAAIRLNPHYPEAYNNLGVALDQGGHHAEALDAYRQALAVKPDYAEAHCNLGNVYLETGHPAQAMAEYDRALQFKEPFAEAHYNLGLALRFLRRDDEAERQFKLSGRAVP
jgi:tetratricopeptide (TPR) repeat protein